LPASERHPLPNLSPQRKKERTLAALIRQLEGLARQQPVVMVFEDAHWIDPTSRELLDLTVERVRGLPVLLIVTISQGYLAIALFCLGFPDGALAQSNAVIAEAWRLAHPPTLTVSLSTDARLLSLTGDYAALDQRAGQLIAVATEQGFPLYRVLGTIYRGWVKVNTGDLPAGISLLRSGSNAYSATGAQTRICYHTALLAKACEIAGQVEEALSHLDDALQLAEAIGERWFMAEVYRHKGELMIRQGDSEAAEEFYRKALGIAEKQETKLWELRAAVSLARLYCDQGHRSEAHDLLAPVYTWFTEGFDTPDLRGAKASQNRMMTLIAFLQAQNCSNLPGSGTQRAGHPSCLARERRAQLQGRYLCSQSVDAASGKLFTGRSLKPQPGTSNPSSGAYCCPP
jgi:predicted ATPase